MKQDAWTLFTWRWIFDVQYKGRVPFLSQTSAKSPKSYVRTYSLTLIWFRKSKTNDPHPWTKWKGRKISITFCNPQSALKKSKSIPLIGNINNTRFVVQSILWMNQSFMMHSGKICSIPFINSWKESIAKSNIIVAHRASSRTVDSNVVS